MMYFSMMLSAMLAPVAASPAPAPAPVQRLSDHEVARILAEAAAKREAAEAAAVPPKRAIHGEVGVEVGTGGHRAVYGSAFVPLGEDGGAVVSMSSQSGGDPDRRRHRERR